ncbi:TonB-dependent receptor [Flammeovirgaceae bacterium SG7u.111]|nr:TonB-dependent receptor [Flammeovirgaceae bacterium SG7u.132]WPO33732.1 TonB-dependent receptor [Flammeovirgaceae bacterium SG7u.111]
MKLKILKQIVMMPKYAIWGVFLQCFLCSMILANDGKSQHTSIEKIYLSLDCKSAKVNEVFANIEKSTNLKFAYFNDILKQGNKISIHAQNKSLAYILRDVAKQTNLKFKRVNGSIFVEKRTILGPMLQEELKDQSPEQRKIEGRVLDETDQPLPGVSILIKGTSTGTTTDFDGNYSLSVPAGSVLVFSYIGFKDQEITLTDQARLNVSMEPDLEQLEEVVVVGYGEQKKTSLVSSVTSVNIKQLKTPSANLTNAIAGRVSGVISFQQSGEPGLGTDNSTFFIRGLSTFGTGKRSPLILIDGIESTVTDMARLQPDDISDFSVLKDASASSIYGARGANGVVLINTKLGLSGKTRFFFRMENRISTNTQNIKLADNISYMNMENEANVTRSPNNVEPYTQYKINNTMAGADPNLFPNNDWMGQLIKDYTYNQGFNLNLSGGAEKARYYIAGTYNRDNGILKIDPINDFNNNITLNNYSIRSNVDLDITNTTNLVLRVYGQFDDYTGPIGGGGLAFHNALNANPVMFPKVYPKEKLPYIDHPLFGSDRVLSTGNLQQTGNLFVNPYAEMVKGYQTYKSSNINPQLEINQDLEFFTKGLRFRGMSYIKRTSFVSQNRFYNPFFYKANINPTDGNYNLEVLNDGGQNSIGTPGTEYLNYSEDNKTVASQFWMQGVLEYNRLFGMKHSVGGLLLGYISHYEIGNPGSLIESLPNRNTGLSGRFTYGYDDRYLVELNFGYNGSERFSEQNRFGFFPSAGLGYNISKEAFFQPLTKVISNLKLRATFGVVGNDQIGDTRQRFLYLSNVNLNNEDFGASFGKNDGAATYYRPGISVSRYANDNITWEESRQINIGMDLGLFDNSLELVVDAFKQYRSQILQPITYTDNAAGLQVVPLANYGKAETQGIDLSLNYNKNITRQLNMNLRGTFTYATSSAIKLDELAYQENLAHLSRVGQSLSQEWGYIAERLFVSDEEVANSPVQFGNTDLRAGDIKYRDVTGDGVINSDDRVPLGYPTQPEIIYGFGASIIYKNFDFNFYFQGSARSTFFIDPRAIQPFYKTSLNTYYDPPRGTDRIYQTGLLEAIADDYWTESNPDQYAFWPRLSTWRVDSNNERSTWWMRNGSFIRLKSVDIGYNMEIPKLGIDNLRIYLSGTNLLMISKFNLWDVEMGGNGLNYPIQSTYNLGFSLNF